MAEDKNPSARIAHAETREAPNNLFNTRHADVVLDDGRTGSGYGSTDSEAISSASSSA